MCASRAYVLIALSLALGLSGCYGYCGGNPYYYGGYGATCDGYPAYGGYGYPDPGFGWYDDCVDPEAWVGYGQHGGRDRITLRDRLRARREARMARREGRGHRDRRQGRHGGRDCECCCGCYDGCGDCCWSGFECCDSDFGPCGDCCLPCSSVCGDCGPCLDGCSGWEVMPGCTTCDSGMPGSVTSEPTCAGGNCPVGPGWEGAPRTFPPYSHETQPAEPTPRLREGGEGESLLHPPDRSNVPEGQFGPADDGTGVIRGPQAAAGVRHTEWVPPRF